ncbi:MAG: 6-phosphogluconolactonase [Pseudomonadota bacterium]
MTPDVLSYPDREALSLGLALRVSDQLKASLDTRARTTLAVPGGTTPGPFLTALSQRALAWDRVDVLLTDERFVPETSERSNTALLRRSLLHNQARAARLVPLVAEARRPEDVLPRLSEGVRAALPLEVCVLGMGADMHTASLFPGADKLAEALDANAPPLLPMRAPGAPEPRLTLTAPVLTAAAHLHLLITGEEKRAALDAALSDGPAETAPVRVLFSRPVTVHWAP